MNFNELSSEPPSQALITLRQLISARGELGEADCRCVAAAFIAMERQGSYPDRCDDGTQP
jgi:hypothetical protein